MFRTNSPDTTPLRCAIVDPDDAWPPRAHLAMQPGIRLCDVSGHDVASAFEEQTIEAALIAPWDAFTVGGLRLLPGIGIAYRNREGAADRPPGDACAAAEQAFLDSLQNGAPVESLLQGWADLHAGPLVWRVWACRNRLPYPALRRAMAAAHQAGMAESAMDAIRYHHIASEESDSLRYLLGLLQRHGRVAADVELLYC